MTDLSEWGVVDMHSHTVCLSVAKRSVNDGDEKEED